MIVFVIGISNIMDKNSNYKTTLDEKIEEILKDTSVKMPERKLTPIQKFTDNCCEFFGDWAWFWVLNLITILYMYLNSIKAIAWDVYPYQLYTMIISVWALDSNIFVQMSTNRIMEQLIWTISQIFAMVQKILISLMLLHEKVDLNNQKLDCIIQCLS